ncbi:hypothetical protein C7475_109165 [Chitinophaga sp. S165]|nr:hypothetical protein C7475_109165 [Chitinophaga sp. S165]
MKRISILLMTIAGITGAGIAGSRYTLKNKFATITVYALKNSNGLYSYYTQVLPIILMGATCKFSAFPETCTFTTTLSLTRLNDPLQIPNYTTWFPPENIFGHPYVNYLSGTYRIYKK